MAARHVIIAISVTAVVYLACCAAGTAPSARASGLVALESTGIESTDIEGPTISGVMTLPAVVRTGIELKVSLVATANDRLKGNSNIAGAEYYIGTDPGKGNGTPMSAADGAFDSALEFLQSTVDSSAWTADTRIYVRAKDAADNWSSTLSVNVKVSDDVTPPGRITDLSAEPAGSMEWAPASVSAFSSQTDRHPVTALLDGDRLVYWRTLGTATPEEQSVTLDMMEVTLVSMIQLVDGAQWWLMPRKLKVEVSDDGETWDMVSGGSLARIASLSYVYQFESTFARYVRISGPGVYDSRTGKYCWEIGDASLYNSEDMLVRLKWTAPADNGYLGDQAGRYDVRYSIADITPDNFDKTSYASGAGSPNYPGRTEDMVVRVDSTDGAIYMALRTIDEAGNEAQPSEAVKVTPYATGFQPVAPDDFTDVESTGPAAFEFRMDSGAKPAFICFSNSYDFPVHPVTNPGGRTKRTVRFPIRPKSRHWKPTADQWRAIKGLVPYDGVVYWRLEGIVSTYTRAFGPTRAIAFDLGEVTGLMVDNAHSIDSTDALWPTAADKPQFRWIDITTDMKYFLIDVSIESTAPLRSPGRTITIDCGATTEEQYDATDAQWLAIRRLAARSGGVLYWRVRAKDAEKVLVAASDPEPLIVDPGSWTVQDPDSDPITGQPRFTWGHTGNGIVRYKLQFSSSAGFSQPNTITLPLAPLSETTYTLSGADVRMLRALASRRHVSSLYWRIRGQDADGAFRVYSDSGTLAVP